MNIFLSINLIIREIRFWRIFSTKWSNRPTIPNLSKNRNNKERELIHDKSLINFDDFAIALLITFA